MQRSFSSDEVNSQESSSNAISPKHSRKTSKKIVTRRHRQSLLRDISESYHIIIKPKLYRSISLSDLTNTRSDISLEFFRQSSQVITHRFAQGLIYDLSSGDGDTGVCYSCKKKEHRRHMWNYNERTPKTRNGEQSPDKAEYTQAMQYDPNFTSGADNSSAYSTEEIQGIKRAAFPFESTPSGNLKVQSNQVVFQSSTVGVLLADPTQAKVKVKFESNSARRSQMPQEETEEEGQESEEPYLQYGPKETTVQNVHVQNSQKTPRVGMRDDKEKKEGRDLASLGYALVEPVDWMRIQLPKKADMMQEIYRRIHNYMNTDTVIHIGDEEFHCHHIILEIYSSFFESNSRRVIELPLNSVSPEAFHIIYEWMIFNGHDSTKGMKKNNILDIFIAAQFLSIKDLEEQCWALILNENLFSEDSAFALYREARVKGLTPVMDLMVPRVMRFFLPLVSSKDFLGLDPEEVMVFLRSNYICVTSEMEVLMAGVRWLWHNWPGRKPYCVDVMRCVRFGLIPPWQLVDIKRNPDNAEILEIVNNQAVQQMVDDGLAYVIIKYWYGNNSKNYYHWIDVLGLTEPADRSWIGEEKNHVTYKEFLNYLEQFSISKDQMLLNMPAARRVEDNPGSPGMPNSMRGMEAGARPKLDFPLPATLRAFTAGGRDIPTMSEFFENKKLPFNPSAREPPNGSPSCSSPRDHDGGRMPADLGPQQKYEEYRRAPVYEMPQLYDPPERDSTDDQTLNTGSSSETATNAVTENQRKDRRHSEAAIYLAAATATLNSGNKRISQVQPRHSILQPQPFPKRAATPHAPATSLDPPEAGEQAEFHTPQISLFKESRDAFARLNMNKLSTSILGPSNKNYTVEGSLFNWDRETVLVFGGIDPHTAYGQGRNTGKDIFRFDPVTNVWDYVGDLPEPRHHHSVAFLRGRVYLVGGADPRDDDIRGKSVVVSTVWSYEPVKRSWYSESGLTIPRKNFGLVVHRMALYAIGGQDKKGRVLRSVERFDPRTGSWSEVRSMTVARMAVAVTKYRDYIWVAGGMTGEKKRPLCRVVECYNSKTNEWTEIHNLRFPRCFATLFAMNDKLYLVGGAGRLCDKDKSPSSVGAIDVWDWKGREWKQMTEMSIPRHGHALAYLGTQLIIIGGVTTIYMRALNNVESFCCERSAWIRGVAALPAPLSGHGAVTLPPASLM